MHILRKLQVLIAVRVQSSKYDLCQVVYDETIEDGFHGFVRKLNHSLHLSARSAFRFGARELWYFSQSNRRENCQNRTRPNNKAQEKFRNSCRSSPASKTAVKTRWLPGVAKRLKVSRIAVLQFNKDPKYQSAEWLVWATTAGQAPRLKTKLIWGSTFWGTARKNFKTSRYPGFRLWSAKRAARMLAGIKYPRMW